MRNYVNCLHQASSSVAILNFTKRTVTSASVNKENFSVFQDIGNTEWANEKSGAMKPLHALNRLRVPWIVSYYRKPLSGLNLLDVGCGAGLVTNALCRLGANVVGLDVDEEKINFADGVATNTLCREQRARVRFHCSSIEDYASDHAEAFDGVIASEVLEHVTNAESFVRHCVVLAKPKSKLFFTTINKTIYSRLLAVWMAENVFFIVPKGVHDWEHFVKPSLLRSVFFENGCRTGPILGMIYNPLTNIWSWSSLSQVNYAVVATKN